MPGSRPRAASSRHARPWSGESDGANPIFFFFWEGGTPFWCPSRVGGVRGLPKMEKTRFRREGMGSGKKTVRGVP